MIPSYKAFLSGRQKNNCLRELHGKTLVSTINLSHNDYLNLGRHPDVVRAGIGAAEKWGVCGHASRVLLTDNPLYQELEDLLATSLHRDQSLLFVSGYQINATALSALLDGRVLGQKPLVFTDRMIHASLHHGCNLAQARQLRYRHNDLSHLSDLLSQHAWDQRPKFIVTETVFSMDGDITNVQELSDLAEKHGAFLYLDEAHALGVLGTSGYGTSHLHTNPERSLIMGTFSKGIGCSGAFTAGSSTIIRYLTNACSGLIYTTAPSPVSVATSLASWRLLPQLTDKRDHIHKMSRKLREKLSSLGFQVGHGESHIIPVILGNNLHALEAKQALEEKGICVSAIRPPTVPLGTARLRLALHAGVREEDLTMVADAFRDGVKRVITKK